MTCCLAKSLSQPISGASLWRSCIPQHWSLRTGNLKVRATGWLNYVFILIIYLFFLFMCTEKYWWVMYSNYQLVIYSICLLLEIAWLKRNIIGIKIQQHQWLVVCSWSQTSPDWTNLNKRTNMHKACSFNRPWTFCMGKGDQNHSYSMLFLTLCISFMNSESLTSNIRKVRWQVPDASQISWPNRWNLP